MTERVEPMDLGVRWHPNGPEAVFVSGDFGPAILALRAHFDDRDQRCVVLTCQGMLYAQIGSPNEDAHHLHPLYDKGLGSLLWAGIVHDSSLLTARQGMWSENVSTDQGLRPRGVRHFVIVTKEELFEFLAESVTVSRVDGTPREAAAASLAS